MRWVNETLPPRLRARWLLMTTRLSISSLAGTARTLVAVGTVRLASMFATTRAAGPRRRTVVSAASSAAGAAFGAGAFGAAAWGCAGAGAGAVGAGRAGGA